MSLVRLDDHRTTCSQRRRCIATSDRKRKRKVARAKHGHRPKGDEPQANIRFRERLAFRVGVINPNLLPPTFFQQGGKQVQLATSASDLALQARRWKSSF